MRRAGWLVLMLAPLAGDGCGGPDPPPAGTGAREAAVAFLEAVSARDWPAAHERLTPEARGLESAAAFGRRADAYRRGWGFEPAGVRVRACEEHGDSAIAHLTVVGRKPSEQFREALALRRAGGAWTVTPPAALTRSPAR